MKTNKFKNLVSVLVMISMLFLLTACGNTKVINGKEYDTAGLFTKRNPKIEYKVIWGNVIWGCLLIETIIAPIYFFGFSCMEPVGIDDGDPDNIGVVK